MLKSVLVAIVLSSVAVLAAPRLSLTVSGPDAVEKVDDLQIMTTVTNTGDEVLTVLNEPNGVLSNLPTDTFDITNDAGVAPGFIGMRVKYVIGETIESGSATTLAPGQTITTMHDLSEAYDFTNPGEGRYSIKAKNTFYVVNPSTKEINIIEAGLDKAHTAYISGKLVVVNDIFLDTSLEKRATFQGCSANQQRDINNAIREATNYASRAVSALQAAGDTERYRTWFGIYRQERHNTVLDHFNRIFRSGFNTFTYNCTGRCDHPDAYAYVFPEIYGRMWLCNGFWRAPLTGQDSKGGTLVHESSHYSIHGDTRDYKYGTKECKQLAQRQPTVAVKNADSHEYFAENPSTKV